MGSPSVVRRRVIGGALAAAVIGAWLAVHVGGVFFWRWTPVTALLSIPVVLLETWLGAGMFIVAHDAIHGSLFPGWRRANAVAGQLAVGLYAGFDYRLLAASHHRHHAAPGTDADPDFHAEAPRAFWPWFTRFFLTYFRWWELARLALAFWIYILVFKASPLNMAVFWGLPSLLSAVQLFLFGTWLPHRHETAPFAADSFADRHRARTIDRGRAYTLATCFHFGLHHEHHTAPHEPWWRLPAVRKAAAG